MIPYLTFIIIAGIVALIYRGVCEGGDIRKSNGLKDVNWTPYAVCLCVALICFVAARDITVGADNPNYLGSLHYYAGISWGEVFTCLSSYGHTIMSHFTSCLRKFALISIYPTTHSFSLSLS